MLLLLPMAGNTSLFLPSQKQRREEPSGGFPNYLVVTYLDKWFMEFKQFQCILLKRQTFHSACE